MRRIDPQFNNDLLKKFSKKIIYILIIYFFDRFLILIWVLTISVQNLFQKIFQILYSIIYLLVRMYIFSPTSQRWTFDQENYYIIDGSYHVWFAVCEVWKDN